MQAVRPHPRNKKRILPRLMSRDGAFFLLNALFDVIYHLQPLAAHSLMLSSLSSLSTSLSGSLSEPSTAFTSATICE